MDLNCQVLRICKAYDSRYVEQFIVVLDHDWGGGAGKYMENRIQSMLNHNTAVMRIVDNADAGLQMIVYYDEYEATFRVDRLEDTAPF